MNIYFDNAATTKLHPRVLDKMIPYLSEAYGNPSSIHSFGRKTRVAVEESREIIAHFINADPNEIFFTSGGTESNNFIIRGIAETEFSETGRNKIYTSVIEHPSVLSTFENLSKSGFHSTYMKVDTGFNLSLEELREMDANRTSLVSFMHINNESGTIFPLSEFRKVISKNTFIHTDAVQSFGKLRIDVEQLGLSALSASAHKIYGPKGIGIAFIKSGTPMHSLISGGGQERNRRAGTENVASIVGFAEAVNVADKNLEADFEKVSSLKELFIARINETFGNQLIINNINNSSPYILSVSLNTDLFKADSESILMFLDINGIAASSGSACSSGTLKPSHVILASGKSNEYAKGTIRFSFSPQNTAEEIEHTIKILKNLLSGSLKIK